MSEEGGPLVVDVGPEFIPSDYTYCPDHDALFLAFMNLLPRGTAWDNVETTTNRSSVIRQFMSAIALSYLHFEDAMCVSLDEWICKTSDEDLDMWAREYGVPDECDIYNQNLCAKVRSTGSATAEYLNGLLEASGYSVEGRWLTGDDIEYPGVHSTFRVVVDAGASAALTAKPVFNFPLGQGVRFGDIGGNQIEDLECMLQRYVPAHCVVDVAISGEFEPSDLGVKLKAWWSAETTANGPVSNWLDTVSSMAASSAGAYRPLSEVTDEGYRVITFDGEDDYLRTGNLTVHPSGDGVSEVFALFNKTAFGGAAALLVFETDGAAWDFLTDDTTRRVAVKAAGSTVEYALRDFFITSVGSQKLVWNRSGFLEWTPHNLVIQSENLQISWAHSGATSPTATFLLPTAVNAAHYTTSTAQTAPLGSTWTFSTIVSAAGYSKIGLKEVSTSNTEVAYDLAAGTVIYQAAAATGTITALGGGQFLLTHTCAMGVASLRHYIYVLADSYVSGAFTPTWVANGTFGINIFRSQVNRGIAPTTYLKTTTTIRAAIAIDYDPLSHEPMGALIESTAINLCFQSQNFEHANWSKALGYIVIVPNAIMAPDGTMTGCKAVNNYTAAQNRYMVSAGITATVGQYYTYSLFAKAGEMEWFSLAEQVLNTKTFFNVRTGKVGTKSALHLSASIQPVGDGWYRCSFTMIATAPGAAFTIYLQSADNQLTYAYPNLTDAIFFWGAQVELTGFTAPAAPTSYIPTTTAAVTRAGDVPQNTPAQINYNTTTAGSWWMELRPTASSGSNPRVMTYAPSSAAPFFYNTVAYGLYDPPNVVPSKNIGATTPVLSRIISVWQEPSDSAIAVNGLAPATSTGALTALLSPATTLINWSGMQGHIRRARYLPRRPDNTEMQTMTTFVGHDMRWLENTVLETFDTMQWETGSEMGWFLE